MNGLSQTHKYEYMNQSHTHSQVISTTHIKVISEETRTWDETEPDVNSCPITVANVRPHDLGLSCPICQVWEEPAFFPTVHTGCIFLLYGILTLKTF